MHDASSGDILTTGRGTYCTRVASLKYPAINAYASQPQELAHEGHSHLNAVRCERLASRAQLLDHQSASQMLKYKKPGVLSETLTAASSLAWAAVAQHWLPAPTLSQAPKHVATASLSREESGVSLTSLPCSNPCMGVPQKDKVPVRTTSSPTMKVETAMVSREEPSASLALRPWSWQSCAMAVVIALRKIRPTSCTCTAGCGRQHAAAAAHTSHLQRGAQGRICCHQQASLVTVVTASAAALSQKELLQP